MARGDLRELVAAIQRARAARAPERGVSDQREAELGAARDHAASQRAVLQRAQSDLHGRDRCQLERFVELGAGHVREPDAAHQSLLDETGERAHRRSPRCPRVGRMDQEQVDRQSIERRDARFAISSDCLRAAIRHPRATGSRHAALGDDPCAPLPSRGAEPAGQQALVVTEPGSVWPVRVRGIEHRYAGAGGGQDRV